MLLNYSQNQCVSWSEYKNTFICGMWKNLKLNCQTFESRTTKPQIRQRERTSRVGLIDFEDKYSHTAPSPALFVERTVFYSETIPKFFINSYEKRLIFYIFDQRNLKYATCSIFLRFKINHWWVLRSEPKHA